MLQIVLAAVILGTFRPQVLLLAAASFPIYLRALRTAEGRHEVVGRRHDGRGKASGAHVHHSAGVDVRLPRDDVRGLDQGS